MSRPRPVNVPTRNREPQERAHVCGNCRWEGKGRDDCPNNKARFEQVKEALKARAVKHACPARFCPLKDHAECWRDYDRQEEALKYGRE